MNDMINDWVPETKDLLNALTAAGFTLRGGHNGEYGFKFNGDLDKFIEDLIACDETNLYVMDPSNRKRTLFLVLGNSPGEIVCDYSLTEGMTDYLEPVTMAHYDKWTGRKQPKKPNPYRR